LGESPEPRVQDGSELKYANRADAASFTGLGHARHGTEPQEPGERPQHEDDMPNVNLEFEDDLEWLPQIRETLRSQVSPGHDSALGDDQEWPGDEQHDDQEWPGDAVPVGLDLKYSERPEPYRDEYDDERHVDLQFNDEDAPPVPQLLSKPSTAFRPQARSTSKQSVMSTFQPQAVRSTSRKSDSSNGSKKADYGTTAISREPAATEPAARMNATKPAARARIESPHREPAARARIESPSGRIAYDDVPDDFSLPSEDVSESVSGLSVNPDMSRDRATQSQRGQASCRVEEAQSGLDTGLEETQSGEGSSLDGAAQHYQRQESWDPEYIEAEGGAFI